MERDVSIDYLRVISCLLVIIIHLTSDTLNLVSLCKDNFWLNNILNSLGRCSVPLFVLISGRYLLGRTQPINEFYSKRFKKIIIPLIFWTAFFSSFTFLRFIMKDDGSAIREVLYNFILGKPFYHLWYMFMLVGLYLVTPFLNYYFSNGSRNPRYDLLIGIGFLLFALLHTTFRFYFDGQLFFPLWFVDYLGYFIMGFVLQYTRKINNIILIIAYFISVALICIANVYTLINFKSLYFIGYNSIFVIISSLAMYKIFSQVKLRSTLFSDLAKYSFGIFLIHPIFIIVFDRIKIISSYVLVELPIVFLCSLLLTLLFKKIPYLKKVV